MDVFIAFPEKVVCVAPRANGSLCTLDRGHDGDHFAGTGNGEGHWFTEAEVVSREEGLAAFATGLRSMGASDEMIEGIIEVARERATQGGEDPYA